MILLNPLLWALRKMAADAAVLFSWSDGACTFPYSWPLDSCQVLKEVYRHLFKITFNCFLVSVFMCTLELCKYDIIWAMQNKKLSANILSLICHTNLMFCRFYFLPNGRQRLETTYVQSPCKYDWKFAFSKWERNVVSLSILEHIISFQAHKQFLALCTSYVWNQDQLGSTQSYS